jgi:hypothetical protein
MKRELILGCVVLAVFSSCAHLGKSELPSSSPRAKEIQAAMNQTVIPKVDLENVKPEDALKFWDEMSTSYHPQHFKFVHVVSYPVTYTVQTQAASAGHGSPSAGPPAVKLHNVTVRRKNITSERLLDEICQQANLTWIIMGREIIVRPKVPGADAQP